MFGLHLEVFDALPPPHVPQLHSLIEASTRDDVGLCIEGYTQHIVRVSEQPDQGCLTLHIAQHHTLVVGGCRDESPLQIPGDIADPVGVDVRENALRLQSSAVPELHTAVRRCSFPRERIEKREREVMGGDGW